MAKLKYDWKYGENSEQKYYETKVGKQTLCIFANKWVGLCYLTAIQSI